WTRTARQRATRGRGSALPGAWNAPFRPTRRNPATGPSWRRAWAARWTSRQGLRVAALTTRRPANRRGKSAPARRSDGI
ncbi:MAG: hypothetical protein AVDCRST_MAG04-595, partial [uncultured Acetobacteraceae bacterium]